MFKEHIMFCFERKYFDVLFPRATKLRQGNIFRIVCQEFCPQGGACVAGGMHGGGCAGAEGGGHVWQGGTCMVREGCAWWGGVCMVGEGHAW